MTIRLEFVGELTVSVATPVVLSEGPEGMRRTVQILSGRVEGPKLNATVQPGGVDHQLIKPDGLSILEARYALKTDDGAAIYVINRAFRHGPPDVMARVMGGEIVDTSLYYFRTAPSFETADPRYDWLNRTLFVGEGERTKETVKVKFYAVV
jgi:hypothetical protein